MAICLRQLLLNTGYFPVLVPIDRSWIAEPVQVTYHRAVEN